MPPLPFASIHRAAVMLLVLFSGACAMTDSPLGSNDTEQAHSGPRLYVYDCGRIGLADVAAFGLTNAETDVRELVVPCYVVHHPEGRLLWDAGMPLELAGTMEPVPAGQGMTQAYTRSLLEQLADQNLTPADIDKVAFSHMHFDHVGAANAFSSAQLLIQQAEYSAAFENADAFPGLFTPALYDELHNSRRRVLNGDHDVFGDGTVQIIAAPGHTPGHQVLLLRLENTGPLVLSGDLYHFRFNREERRTPVFNVDAALTLRSMDKVEALIERENATLWIQHDKATFDGLRTAPAYYD